MDDALLLARLRTGDAAAFDELFRRYYARLVGFCEARLGGRHLAEDVVQDVMLELWRRRETISIDESCKAYLYRAARNRVLNELRHEATVRHAEPTVRDELPAHEAAPADAPAVAAELEARIAQSVTALADPIRECFLMSRRDGLAYAEIAAALQISVKTVEARMGRALRELRSALAEWLPERH